MKQITAAKTIVYFFFGLKEFYFGEVHFKKLFGVFCLLHFKQRTQQTTRDSFFYSKSNKQNTNKQNYFDLIPIPSIAELFFFFVDLDSSLKLFSSFRFVFFLSIVSYGQEEVN